MKHSFVINLLTTALFSVAGQSFMPEFAIYKIHTEKNTNRIFAMDFADDSAWTSHPSTFKGTVGCEKHQEDNQCFIRVGGQNRYGHGVKNAEHISVTPGVHLALTFKGRVPDLLSSFIIYTKLYDKSGKDITDSTLPNTSWTYSPHSHTHCMYPVTLNQANVWQDVVLPYTIPEGVHFMDIAVCQWRGTFADCSALSVDVTARTVRQKLVFNQTVSSTANGSQQTLWQCHDESLSMAICTAPQQEATAYTLSLTYAPQVPTPLALDIEFSMKHPLTGWTWHKTWRKDLSIQATSCFMNGDTVSGIPVSLFPFTAVSNGSEGFALGVPLTHTVLEYRTVTATGITSTTHLGMIPQPHQASTATLSWITTPFDASWGFRAAAQTFYRLYPTSFASIPSNLQEGCWLWPTSPSALPQNHEDFGLAYWEASANIATHQQEIAQAHERGIGIFPYTEPWGMRQRISSGKDDSTLMPFDERIKQLRQWAADTSDKTIWFEAPRHIAAQAALNSLPIQPDGTHPFAVDQYDAWFHWWRTNPDPRLPLPNRASICWDYAIQPALNLIDGVYLDSLDYKFAVKYMNTRPDHLTVMKEPLTYDPQTVVPCANGIQHQVAFVQWLADKLHPLGKHIFGNIFGLSHRFHSHLIDIFGSEVGSFGSKRHLTEPHDDDTACIKRFYAYHRPVCNLLQEGSYTQPTQELTHEQIIHYVEHQLFYGFYPGITTIGGEEKAGYANWKRYFGPQRQCERERHLFKQVIPIIRQLNKAGWQPVTCARSDNPAVILERYADTAQTFFTLRNTTGSPAEATIIFDSPMRFILLYGNDIAIPDTLSNTLCLTLPPFRTLVLKRQP